MTFYEILGVSPEATPEEIKAAYRELAKKYHPDRNPGDSMAEAKMKEVNEAYSTLSDPQKRQEYDYSLNGPAFDPFEHAFTNAFVNRTMRTGITIDISIKEVLEGGEREVPINLVKTRRVGKGLESTPYEHIQKFKFPRGCRDGISLIFREEIEGTRVELIVSFRVNGPYKFGHNGDVLTAVPVDYPTLVLGGTKTVTLLDGTKKELKIPAGFQPLSPMRVAGGGIPRGPNETRVGDLIIRIDLETYIPENIPVEALEALKLYKERLEQVAKQ